ncbi:MAG: hypothetical protein ACHBN1_09640 [Heteroscytonema crispum UTEX LB 1556]
MGVDGRPFTTNHQPQRGSPVAWVGKPYQGREVSRGESSRLQTQAPLHHQPPTPNPQPPTTNHQPPTLN